MTIYLGENIKRLRHKKGITQETLAEFLSVSFQSVSRWERGESYPDITMLPLLSKFFGVSVDELLGMNEAQDEEKIKEYLQLYDDTKLKDLPLLYEKMKEALKEFPNDFRIQVRYMSLLQEVKIRSLSIEDIANYAYEKISKEIGRIYDSIQSRCTDDSIRIWSKTIMISHLLWKYQSVCDENGKYRVYKEYLEQAEEIIRTLPAMSDCKEIWTDGLAWDYETRYGNRRKLLEELLYHFMEAAYGYCFLECTAEERIKCFEYEIGLMDIIFSDGEYGKNYYNKLYTLGQLGYLYHQEGDDDKALEYLRSAAEYAKKLDSEPDVSEKAKRFYNIGPVYRETSASEFMRIVMTGHYPLSDEFKSTAEFKEILAVLDS